MLHSQWLEQIQKIEYKQEEEYYRQLAIEFLENAEKALKEKEYFCAVLGGGNTPQHINKQIVKLHSNYNIDWNKVYIILSDERWVKETDKLSNYKMIKETLVEPLNIRQFYNIYKEQNNVTAGAKAYADYIQHMLDEIGQKGFDYALLGVGNDGHTASLFPERPQLTSSNESVICGGIGPEGLERISLSFDTLNKCKITSFLVNSTGKRNILSAMEKEWNPDKYPIQNIRTPKKMHIMNGE